MTSKKVSKEYYILKDMNNDDRFGERHILSDRKPTISEPQFEIVGTVQISGDIALFDRFIDKCTYI